VPVTPAPGGCCIEIGPQYRTVWYEIVVSGNPSQQPRAE